jgi:hypothetical protein
VYPPNNHFILINLPAMTLEEVQARHRKEIKALDGEKRAQLKKAKATAGKGKKAKEVMTE